MIGLFNRIWQEDEFPVMWSAAVLLPFLKPEKMGNVPLYYRPITLASCLCKIFEKMINSRLMWALESIPVLHPNQYGFRRCRSTVDSLARLDDYIKLAFARKQHVVAVFINLEKAYDTTRRYHILETLKDAGFRGHLPKFIQRFLSNRRFTVKIGSTFSDEYIQHEGVPQGSVLSCTLFALAVNGLPSSVPDGVESFLHVDYFALVTASSCLASAERRLQLAVGRAHQWATAHGFKFSPQKTVAMHFTKKRGLFPPLDLSLGRNHIREVSETRFLGMILDSKLTWIPHLKYIKHKSLRSLNLLKCISKKNGELTEEASFGSTEQLYDLSLTMVAKYMHLPLLLLWKCWTLSIIWVFGSVRELFVLLQSQVFMLSQESLPWIIDAICWVFKCIRAF